MKTIRKLFVWWCRIVGVGGVAAGVFASQPLWVFLGIVGFALGVFGGRLLKRSAVVASLETEKTDDVFEEDYPRPAADAQDADSLVEEMLQQGRCTLLLRPQIIKNLALEERRQAWRTLQAEMSIVPVGEVVLGNIDDIAVDGRLNEADLRSNRLAVIQVDGLFLDRHLVTNREYCRFVVNAGYEQMAIWDREIWSEMMNFVDQTGVPGPKYWHNGRYKPGKGQHPVIGVSWYEAAAYARWIGKRLPTDAEWVKAGSWPVVLSNTSRAQRKFPWGNSMEKDCANLWASDNNGTVAVDDFSHGVSVGGVHQLIGNVWEWTSDAWHFDDDDPNAIIEQSVAMKSIRGGAYDTYFENQATCQFQSGENPVSRSHNIGFRCAVGICDLDPSVMAGLGEDDECSRENKISAEVNAPDAANNSPAGETNREVEVTA